MCGIAGIYDPGRRPETDALETMMASMAHRGPDDRGIQVLSNGQLLFGHLRLSILDLSPLGHQPMTLPDRKTWIVYNGEIYNFRELKRELATLGWSFRSDTDTEVILAAYKQWGLRSVERFHGMFAFALWDDERAQLHLCRDRFGVKPLYYSVIDGTLAFASEIKALNYAGYTARTANAAAVAEFTQFGYISSPRSIFEDVHTVRPGTIRTFGQSLSERETRYWNTADIFDGEGARGLRAELGALGDAELLQRVEDSLKRAFEYRMVADVPVGLFLSGGIDSSLVAAILTRYAGIKLNTFTIGYGDSEFDERVYARKVAEILGSNHVELAVSPAAAIDLVAEIPEIADEPIGDSSLLPTLMVSRLARRDVKVALSADGADELFGGYARYAYCGDFLQRRSRLLRGLYALSADVLERLPPALVSAAYAIARGPGPKFAAINDKLRKFVRMSRANGAFEAYEAAISEFSADRSRELVARHATPSGDARSAFEAVRGGGCYDQFMHFDLTRYLPGDLLVKVDRASMFVSLEAREPFLDHEAARLAAALPFNWKIRNGQNKFILRRLLAKYYPAGFFDRPKQGFSAPIDTWLRGPLREVLLQELSPARVREAGILDPAVTSAELDTFLRSDRRGGSAASVWIIFQLQQWASRWLRAPLLRSSPVARSDEHELSH
jgi:asparagine synthase (glutamine-hydrolysing)